MSESNAMFYLMTAGLQPAIQLAILAFGIIAARRHKLPGLWVLVGAMMLTMLLTIANIVIHIIQPDRMRGYFELLGCFSYAIMIISLCGWGLLAFSRRKGSRSDA